MRVAVYDPAGLWMQSLDDAFLDRDLRAVVSTGQGDALKSCIMDPALALFLLMMPDADINLFDAVSAGLKEINPMIEIMIVCRNDSDFELLREDAVARGAFLIPFSSGAEDVADAVLGRRRESGGGRQAHRISCNLQAVIYNHDDMDQKIVEGSHVVEVVSLSSNGAYVAVGRCEVEEGQTYLFEITLPDLIYLVKGEVVWLNLERDVGGRPRGFALRFLDMSTAPQELLESRIREDMIDSILKRRGLI